MNTLNPPGDHREPQEEIIDLTHYWRVLLLQKWNILAVVVVVTLAAALIAFSLTPIYRSTVTILIENQETKVLSIEDVYGLNTSSKEYLLTQFEILKSRELAERVVDRLQLTTHPLFDPRQKEPGLVQQFLPFLASEKPVTDDAVRSSVVDQLRDSLSVSPVRNTQLVKVNFESENATLARDVANTMADIFIESYLEAKLEVTQKAATWLGDRLGDLQAKLRESEQRLQDYREQAQLVDIGGVQTQDAEEIEQLTQRYVAAKNERSQAETLFEQVSRLGVNPELEGLLSIPSILSHPSVQGAKLQQAEAQSRVKELSQRYGPKHPTMIAAQSELENANDEMYRQAVRVTDGIASGYQAALQTEQSMQQQLAASKGKIQDLNRKEFRLRELEREVETNRHLYEMFLTRSKETDETGSLQAANARVVDPAVVPVIPVKPNKKLIVALALVVSGMLVSAVALLLDALSNTIRSPDDVEAKLSTNMLGFLPDVRNADKEEGLLTLRDGNFAEGMRTVRTSLMLSSMDKPHKVTLVTSSVPGEGKSTVSSNLAEALGQMESVLLIDADMRRPSLGKMLGLPRTNPGLSNLIEGKTDIKSCVYRIPNTNVDAIVSGIVPDNPLELLSSKRFADFIQLAASKYDRIIIDSAPTHAVSDAMVLSTFADAVVYVVKFDDTAAPLAAKGIRRLQQFSAPIAGVVMNRVDVNKASSYGSYYNGYYQGYGYTNSDVADFKKALEKRSANA